MKRLFSTALAASIFASTSAAQPPEIDRIDPHGIPMRCLIDARPQSSSVRSPSAIEVLPTGTRGWECVPGVIRGDGLETFRLQVDVNGPVQSVRLTGLPPYLVGPNVEPISLRDDGGGQDLVSGDGVWTAGPFRYNVALAFPANYANDASSPAGLYIVSLGTLRIEEPGGALTEFLIAPQVGLLRADVPTVPVELGSADRAVSRHLVNLRSTDRTTQKFMRFLGADLAALTRRVYEVLPDVFDFLFLFSHDRIERTPRTASDNFIAGLHAHVQTNYSGTGLVPYNDSGFYGSASRLLSVNLLDSFLRGIQGNNATHELSHQWASYTATPLNDGSAHYHYSSSVGSLLGGFTWADNGDGTFTRDCDEGRNGAHHADPLDLYLMGLIPDSAVPGQHLSQLPGSPVCDQVIGSYATTTVADIQAVHGPRVPGPATAKRNFSVGFVIESNGRLLNATERTFYDRLAEHYTLDLPANAPDPYVGFNWPTITRFFGNGTTWTTDIVQLTTAVPLPASSEPGLRLAIVAPNPTRGGVRIAWGIPGNVSFVSDVSLEIFDSQGRRQRTLAQGAVSGGDQETYWDGEDSDRRPTPPGVYWVRLSYQGMVASRKVVRLDP